MLCGLGCKPRGACLLVLELWDVGLGFPLSTRCFKEGCGGTCCCPVPAHSKLSHSLSFARIELSKSGTGPCNSASLPTSKPKSRPRRLQGFSFWVILNPLRAHGTEYMRPAGFYKALGVMIMVAEALRRKGVKKMNVGDLCGMTLEG